jgi:hypothetical protein
MSRPTYEELVWQLSRLPGGAEAAMPDFFGRLLAGPAQTTDTGELWPLHDNARLELHGGQLSASLDGESTPIATLPRALLDEAAKAELSPLLLGLLALATGDVDGDRLLKKLLPKVDGAAKDLMLMTVCRLCG